MAKDLIVSSPDFVDAGPMPVKYTADGEGVNPPLVIDSVPDGTQYMALIMEDPDAPRGVFTHWVLWDMEPANSISENTSPGVAGLNTAGRTGYTPPDPPASSGEHRYFFTVFALDTGLDLRTGSPREALEKAMQGHILAQGTLMAHYGRVAEHAH